MRRYSLIVVFAASCGLALILAAPASAARIRYHYVAAGTGAGPDMTQAGGGERLTWRAEWVPTDCPAPRACEVVTFCHPTTGSRIALPLALPHGTPEMQYRNDRVIYNYSGYSVEVHFLADGSADVIYNSGLLGRAP